MTIERTLLAIGLVITLGRGAGGARDQPKLSEKQATEIGTDVYVYGYPLITLEMTRRLTTNTAAPPGLRPDGPIRSPANVPAHNVSGYPWC